MKLARTIQEIRHAVAEARRRGAGAVGLVPTLGALHEGHYSLIGAAGEGCDFVVVSIFVNPTQFGPGEDYEQYPRTPQADLAGCEAHGVGAVFAPEPATMYPAGFATSVRVSGLTERMCGASRPGHFEGVCTVVAKLIAIVDPDRVYFGAKDYQQAAVIRRMVADLNMRVLVEVRPTVRERDGLAISSRNVRLSAEERSQATALHESLQLARRMVEAGERRADRLAEAARKHLTERAPLAEIDYVEVVDAESLADVETIVRPAVVAVAVRFSSARLIDNMALEPPGSCE
jgi:pantoate--beta-alanine ligase